MIRKNLVQLIFSGASLWRWNDKLRPNQLAEIEKQAHKALLAFVLWHEASQSMEAPERQAFGVRVIEGCLFDYFYRLVITDIKPPVFYKIRQNREHHARLTEYVLAELEPALAGTGAFWKRLRNWHLDLANEDAPERRVLNAAHLFASQWEFRLIRPHNPFDDEMDGIAADFEDKINAYRDLPGMIQLLDNGGVLAKFANLCGQLRFQIRWGKTPRIPATSVLGHMFIVAACAYLFSDAIGASAARRANNFFGGLFHDFPEVLTRDIISPVKRSIPGLSQIIREYEVAELNRRVLSPLAKAGFRSLASRVSWHLGLEAGSEFQDCYRKNGEIAIVSGFDALAAHDHDLLDPRDGQLLKACDLLAAFLEAHNSIHNGISSPHLVEARGRLKNELRAIAPPALRLDALLADFD